LKERRVVLTKNKKETYLDKETEETNEESSKETMEGAEIEQDKTDQEKDKSEEHQNKIDLLLAQIEELNDQLLRAQAEIQNVRRVAREEVTRVRLFGVESLAREFISVGDNLQRALDSCLEETDVKVIREGLELTLKTFEGSLETAGIIPVNPEKEKLDPEKHEAISVVEDNKKEPNTVIEVIQRGFTIQDRILRPAKVVVTKKSDKK
tara:strand:+ start:234 stop:857 length:624 start_codon:yes stop_codon:yes gene_type:complete